MYKYFVGGVCGNIEHTHQEDVKKKISEKLKGKSYEDLYGKEEAIRQKEKRSSATKSQWANTPEETKENIFLKSGESRKNNGKKTILKKYTCPHCKKEGTGSAMFKHHFENCFSVTNTRIEMPKETRKKVSDGLKEYFSKNPSPSLGIKMKNESRQKISENLKLYWKNKNKEVANKDNPSPIPNTQN